MSQSITGPAVHGRDMAERTVRHVRSMALVLLLAAAGALPVAAQTTERPAPLVGTWLIEPASFDAWVETGFDVPWFPLLVVRADGSFTLYRLAPGCEPVLPNGGELDRMRPEDRRKGLELCAAARQRVAKDGFIAAYLHVSAAGRWSIAGGDQARRIVFAADTTGPTPQHFARSLPSLDGRIAKEIGDPRYSSGEREILASLERFLDTHGQRLNTFYTTLFVFGGEPVPFAVSGGRLALGAGKRAFVYRAIKPEAPDAAMALTLNIGASAQRYFRCALAKIVSEDVAAPTSDAVRLAARLRALSPDLERRADAEDLTRLGHKSEAARLWSEAEEAKMRTELLAKDRHPAMQASRAGTLGRYLGCPNRDLR